MRSSAGHLARGWAEARLHPFLLEVAELAIDRNGSVDGDVAGVGRGDRLDEDDFDLLFTRPTTLGVQ
jgi:hypothetical protein